MTLNRRIACVALAQLGLGLATRTAAQAYPSKLVRIVVPYPAGGFNDTLGRLAAQHLGTLWKKPVIADNKPGAGTMIGTREVAIAAPDGHTILVAQFPFAANPWLYKNIAYDTQKAFAPVVLAGRAPMLVVTHTQSPYRTLDDLVRGAKNRPGSVTYGTSGPGSSNHLAMALFETASGTHMRQVPYKGSTPMLTDLGGGQVEVALDLLPHVMPFIQAGRIRPLAIAAAARSPLLPAVPTVAEAGIPNYEVSSWHGFVVPANTPRPVIEQLNQDLNKVLREPDVRKAFEMQGVTPDGGSVETFRSFIDAQMSLWRKVVQDHQITIE